MLNSCFLKSAKNPEDYPLGDRAEVALMGRSNAGKSTFLNALCGRDLAKVSSAPGKTRLLNFFDIGENYRLVDMPGYGFASRSGSERMSWAQMIENYVRVRDNLVGALLVMDIRRDWSSDEDMIRQWLKARNLPLSVLLNKSDKLKRSELNQRLKVFENVVPECQKFAISAEQGTGVSDVEEFVFRTWVKA